RRARHQLPHPPGRPAGPGAAPVAARGRARRAGAPALLGWPDHLVRPRGLSPGRCPAGRASVVEVLGEVVLEPDLRDDPLLGLDPVEVLLLVGEEVLEQLAGAVVALGDRELDAAVVALDRGDLGGEVQLELLGHGLADPDGAEALEV